MDDKTTIYSLKAIKQELILMTINEVMSYLKDAGYDATSQMVGYLMTNDPTYITSYKNARTKISKFDRSEILTAILNGYKGE